METKIQETQNQKEILFNKSHLLYVISFAVILLIGLAIRFYDLTEAPLDFHPTRQLFSAIKARGMYYEQLDTAPESKKEYAVQQWKDQGFIEPPVMERMSATLYQLVGYEALWIPRVLSIIFWTIGGIFLFLVAQLMVDRNAAIFSFMLFMITPYTAIASRAFQPDPLMVMLMIIGFWGLVRWNNQDNISNAIISGLFAGFAIFIKSVVIFPIAIAFSAVVIYKKRSFKSILKSRSVWIMGLLSLMPYIGYMIYGLMINGALTSEFSLRFFPQLWSDPVFWLRWNEMITAVVGNVFFLASIIGILLLRKPIHRIFLLSLFVGYFLYGLTLSYHISTHDYYQLPLVPIVILGASVTFSQIISGVQNTKWFTNAIVLGVLAFYVAINAWDVRVTLASNDYRNEVTFWQNMSGIFKPDDKVIGISQDYGYRLNYWGWMAIENWMSTSDFSVRELGGQEFDMKALFEEQIKDMDYFLVTQMAELNNQPEIRRLLYENYQIHKETGDYIIFDLTQKIED